MDVTQQGSPNVNTDQAMVAIQEPRQIVVTGLCQKINDDTLLNGTGVYFSGPTFLVLAEISLDRGVPPLLKYTLVQTHCGRPEKHNAFDF